jgi:phosphoserine phosphatase
MADATGHGVGPALSASEVRAMLRMAIRSGERLSNIATFINDQLCQDLHAGRFITAWLCLIDSKDSTLCHFSAGQAPIIHYKASEEDFDIKPANTAPFGIVQDLEIDIEEPIKMQPGDLFLVMSDGVYEAVNSNGEQFGIDRVLDLLKRYASLNASEIMLKLRLCLNEFTGDEPATDDRTVVLIKRSG